MDVGKVFNSSDFQEVVHGEIIQDEIHNFSKNEYIIAPHFVATSTNQQQSTYRGNHFDRATLNGGRIRPSSNLDGIASWNVEGMTESKLVELESIMASQRIGILCMQDTHVKESQTYFTAGGYLVILS